MVETSVVIPAYNEEEHIEHVLDSVQGQADDIIVVAGGNDRTAELAAQHPAITAVLQGKEQGPGAARNRGVRAAEGEIVLFTDADSVVPDNWVESHVRHYGDPAVVGVAGPADPLSDEFKDRVLFKLLSDYWFRLSWTLGLVQAPGYNCSYRREDFMKEKFDEQLPFMEDTELSMRMKQHGKIVYDPDTAVSTSARREKREGYGRVFLKYLRAYINEYVLKREITADYFETREQ